MLTQTSQREVSLPSRVFQTRAQPWMCAYVRFANCVLENRVSFGVLNALGGAMAVPLRRMPLLARG